MNLTGTILLTGIVMGLLPGCAVLLRNRRGWLTVSALFLSLSGAALMALLWRILGSGWGGEHEGTIRLVQIFGVLTLLSGAVLSTLLGRLHAGNFHNFPRRVIALLGLAGAAVLLIPDSAFLLEWTEKGPRLLLDSLGKAYLTYALLGLIIIAHNVENTYRIARGVGRKQLRLPFLAIFGLLGYLGFIFIVGLISGALSLNYGVAAVLPIFLASLATVRLLFRERLMDATTGVSRRIIYSSFSVFAAGLALISVAVASQLAHLFGWSPGEVISMAGGFMVILLAVAAVFSSRLQRRVRRFIDRNIYVNRYDYQSQWNRFTLGLDPSAGEEKLLQSALAMLKDVFEAEEVTIALRDESTGMIRPVLGPGCVQRALSLGEESPLGRRLISDQRAILLERKSDDFEYLPIYVENQEWLDATACQALAPLVAGGELLGTIGLERSESHVGLNFEDLELLDRVANHLAGILRAINLGREQAGRREADLMARLSELRERPAAAWEYVDLNGLARRTVDELGLRSSTELEIELDLGAESSVMGDAALLRRALTNVIRSAAEAMAGQGVLSLSTRDYRSRDNKLHLILTVADTGLGMKGEFGRKASVRRLGSPHSGGADLGLFQTRSIIRAHEGDMVIENRNGSGTNVTLMLRAASVAEAVDDGPRIGDSSTDSARNGAARNGAVRTGAARGDALDGPSEREQHAS